MTKVVKGIRVLEVAQFTFVPAAGAILADWGADVIKVDHPTRGDTQRGFINMGGMQLDPDRHFLVEHPNRGKCSVGIDVTTPGGQEMLYEIAKTADVFLIPVKKVLTSQVSDGLAAIGPACRSGRLDAASSEGSCASS